MSLNKQLPWPIFFTFALGVIIPTACILWFMNEAVNNEHLAVKQKVAAIYQNQVSIIKRDALEHWQQHLNSIEETVEREVFPNLNAGKTLPAQKLFAQTINSKMLSSLVIYSENQLLYPSESIPSDFIQKPEAFSKAEKLEFQEKKLPEALNAYKQIQDTSTVPSIQAEAVVGQARCLSKLNKPTEAVKLLNQYFTDDRFEQEKFANGRLIRASALFRTLQIAQDNISLNNNVNTDWQVILQQNAVALEALLSDYSQTVMPSSQRRFLLKQLQNINPTKNLALLYQAEHLAASFLQNSSDMQDSSNALLKAVSNELWRYGTKQKGFIALFNTEDIHKVFQDFTVSLNLLEGLHVSLAFSPEFQDSNKVLAEANMDELAQGWKIQLLSESMSEFESAAKRQIELYILIGALIIFAIIILMTLTMMYVSKQIKSSRLKNDLIATVSHELKTPLSSMRLLVDTLINTEHQYDSTTNDYLHLISKENARLTQLIDNFLTFSRMERNQAPFNFKQVSANELALCAINAVQDKFKDSGFILSSSLLTADENVLADKDMMATALINLLENAFKYSYKKKHIELLITQSEENITFNIKDHGLGIARQHLKRIFNRFYRVEQSVTQNTDGCGLGLSIVNFIVKSHSGDISVTSELGVGSCFSITIPKTNKSDGD